MALAFLIVAVALVALIKPVRAAGSTLVIHAVGHHGTENINIVIDGTRVESFNPEPATIGSFFSLRPDPGWKTYTYNHPTTITASDVRLEFTNDMHSDTIKRDVRVDKIVIDGVTFETEDPSVESRGNWNVARCSSVGNFNVDSLYCNGYFQYSGGGGEVEPGNQDPVARAGDNITVIDENENGTESVRLNGSNSIDSDGEIVSYAWFRDGEQFATGSNPVVSLPLGITELTLRVEDDEGATSEDTIEIRVVRPAQTGESTVLIYAVGRAGSENVNIIIDGRVVDSFTPVQSSNFHTSGDPGWEVYVYSHPTVLSASDIRLAFTNDAHSATLKRDVRVDKIILDGTIFETEAPEVVTKGNWSANNCGPEGTFSVDLLQCNGYIQYVGGQGTVSNRFPVANAGPNQTVIDADGNGQETVTLDGSNSTDADGSIVSHSWKIGGLEAATTAVATVELALGTHTAELTVVDDEGASSTDQLIITVSEPAPNQAPLADAGVDQQIIDVDEDGFESVTLDASNSSDSDGEIVSYEWLEGLQVIATGESPTIDLPVGGHALLLRIVDDEGAISEDGVLIDIDSPSVGGSTLAVHAVGRHGTERIDVMVKGAVVDSFTPVKSNAFTSPNSPGWQVYTYSHPTQIVAADVRIAFVNDMHTDTVKRDVRVDKIVLDGNTFESEDPNVIVKGNWTANRCGSPGTFSVDLLQCNGYFQYVDGGQASGWQVEEVVSSISTPWGVDFLPNEDMIFTERIGRINVLNTSTGAIRQISADLSDIEHGSTGGLLGVAVDPDFDSNRRIYTYMTDNQNMMKVVAWQMNSALTSASRVGGPLFTEFSDSLGHVGGQIVIGDDGYLYVAIGDDFIGANPQDLTVLDGKVLRIDRFTGQGAPGNPFADSSNENTRRIYSYGHRNPQGLAFRPGTSQLWSVEHGSAVDDEINLIANGGNYGWDPVPEVFPVPNPSHPEYDEVNNPMTDFDKFPSAIGAKWSSGDPTIAPGGGDFIDGEAWGDANGLFAVSVLKDSHLSLFEFSASGDLVERSIPPELNGTYGRLRTATMGPDGSLYVGTSNSGFGASDTRRDSILKVTPN